MPSSFPILALSISSNRLFVFGDIHWRPIWTNPNIYTCKEVFRRDVCSCLPCFRINLRHSIWNWIYTHRNHNRERGYRLVYCSFSITHSLNRLHLKISRHLVCTSTWKNCDEDWVSWFDDLFFVELEDVGPCVCMLLVFLWCPPRVNTIKVVPLNPPASVFWFQWWMRNAWLLKALNVEA